MKNWRPLVLLFLLLPFYTQAQRSERYQRKLEELRRQEWPPERSYSRVSLGYALQKAFKKHCEFCGFATPDGRRDYLPEDIGKFLGRRELRSRVETADIRGGGLMYYIFQREDKARPFDELAFSPSRVLHLNSVSNQFVIKPDDNFDAYLFHKTCSAYLKAALDAGIEPPYAAFRAALDTDSRRESSILALSGSFLSPLHPIITGNGQQTAEALLQLWDFYRSHPEFIGNAYYLREFEGVMARHITSAEENYQIETEGALNLNGPLPAHLKASFGLGKSGASTFLGSDWETIIYTDFEGPYQKERLFSPLPSPADIRAYFEGIQPAFQRAQDLPLMVEGVEYKHFLIVEGIPERMAGNFWELAEVEPGVYEGKPELQARYFQDPESGAHGCRFTITGRPLASNFSGPADSRPGKLPLRYRIRSRQPVGGVYLQLQIDEEIQTSSHPIARIVEGSFDLKKKEGWNFAFQWKIAIEADDRYNPIDFNSLPYIGKLLVRRNEEELQLRIIDVTADAGRKRFYVTLESREAYPLERIDNNNMLSYNLSMEVHLKSSRSGASSVRPVKDILRFPAIRPLPAPERPALTEMPAPAAPGTTEGGQPGQEAPVPPPSGATDGN